MKVGYVDTVVYHLGKSSQMPGSGHSVLLPPPVLHVSCGLSGFKAITAPNRVTLNIIQIYLWSQSCLGAFTVR